MSLTRVALLERLLRLTAPRPDPTYTPGPRALDDGLWTIDRRSRFLGIRNPCACTLARVDSGDLVLIGAPSFFGACEADVRALGSIAAVVAPNSFHHSYSHEVVGALAPPVFAVAPGLPARVPDLPPAVELLPGVAAPWGPGLEHVVFGPTQGVTEVIFFHPSTRTLVLTDLAFNIDEQETRWERCLTRVYGIRSRFGPSRNSRLLLASDRASAERALRTAFGWPFERVLVAHGSPVEHAARDRFAQAFAEFL